MKSNLLKVGFTVAMLLVAANAPAPLLTWSASPGANIPDNQPNAGLLSTITINSGDTQFDVFGGNPYSLVGLSTVTLNITGGWNGDYVVTLTHLNPNTLAVLGSVTLLDRIGVTGGTPAGYGNAGFDNTVLSASVVPTLASASSLSAAGQVDNGTYNPGVSYGAFADDGTPLGIWALYITDRAGGDVGTLQGWSLELNVVPEPTTWALLGFGTVAAGVTVRRWWVRRKQ